MRKLYFIRIAISSYVS